MPEVQNHDPYHSEIVNTEGIDYVALEMERLVPRDDLGVSMSMEDLFPCASDAVVPLDLGALYPSSGEMGVSLAMQDLFPGSDTFDI